MSALDNYKYKNTALSELIEGIDSSTSTTIKTGIINNFNLDSSNIVASELPFTGVSELPLDINYKYNGTDISDYAIARFDKYTGGYNVTAIPSWCNKIRFGLCGGGGAGGDSTANQHTQTPYHHQGWHGKYVYPLYYNYHGFHHQQADNAKAGAGGGAGGFVYETMPVTPGANLVVSVGAAGGDTWVKSGVYQYLAYGGGAASTTTKGLGRAGAYLINSNSSAFGNYGEHGDEPDDTVSGDGGDQTKNNASNNYGKGGRGYPSAYPYSISKTDGANTGQDGNPGFAIIYFLKDN
jgi:hypothetical protein